MNGTEGFLLLDGAGPAPPRAAVSPSIGPGVGLVLILIFSAIGLVLWLRRTP